MSKIKVDIYGGEAFPIYSVYLVDKYSNAIIEIDEETFDRWKEAFERFAVIQQEIIDEMKKQGHDSRIWTGRVWSDGFTAEKMDSIKDDKEEYHQ